MELKLHDICSTPPEFGVLIVPYGIETYIVTKINKVCTIVLIVPYGIETQNSSVVFSGKQVLIVPYGIETKCVPMSLRSLIQVLIVPYGIETHVMAGRFHELYRFNRTLWN